MLISFGLFLSFGVFFNPILTDFNWTRALTSGAYSLCMILAGLLGVVMGRLNDKIGPRLVVTICGIFLSLGYLLTSQIGSIWQLYLFYGVMIGIGMAGIWVPLGSITVRWFVSRRSMMTGIVVGGMGAGTLIGPLFTNYIISIYGWRCSYIILGIIVLITIVPIAQLLKLDPSKKGLIPYGQEESKQYQLKSVTKSLSLVEAVRSSQFWMLALVFSSYGFCLQGIRLHIVPHAMDLGFSATTAAIILAASGGVSILGNAVFGIASDRIGNKKTLIIGLILIVLALLWLVPAMDIWKLYLFALVFGLAYGGINAVQSPIIAEVFGLKSHGVILGIIVLFFTVGASSGPYLLGYIFDITSSYRMAFSICAGIVTVGLIMVAVSRPIRVVEARN